jgi:hypothetical protein
MQLEAPSAGAARLFLVVKVQTTILLAPRLFFRWALLAIYAYKSQGDIARHGQQPGGTANDQIPQGSGQ